ncbi:hypothetical protein PVK06_006900 [Gossypium arboreum]|uniref:Alkyl transferase n=1 Tax=Gossypium arboreum TaxID=29729 RepID=A0ABR0QGS9_GOSAR|nr:hypothetical protein PVK06_006900 [Gossypium arboreum]
MDGNRRYARQNKLKQVAGHEASYFSLMSMLIYCYGLGIKYMTAYAFSIDNFMCRPKEVQSIMDLMTEKFELLCRKDILLNDKLLASTVNNSGLLLMICVAYTSTNEIIHAVEKCCEEKWVENDGGIISLADIEKRMYMEIALDPDIVTRIFRWKLTE